MNDWESKLGRSHMPLDRVLYWLKTEYTRAVTDGVTNPDYIQETVKKEMRKVLNKSCGLVLLPFITKEECEKADLFKEGDYFYLPLYFLPFCVTSISLPAVTPDDKARIAGWDFSVPEENFKNITDTEKGIRAVLFKPSDPIVKEVPLTK